MLPGYNFYENETNLVIPSHIVQVYQMLYLTLLLLLNFNG